MVYATGKKEADKKEVEEFIYRLSHTPATIMPEWTGTLLFVEEPKEIVIIGSIHDAPD